MQDEREWFHIELDQVIPMLELISRWCSQSSTTTSRTIQPSTTPAATKGGWWHEDGWKMHCEGATQAAIAERFNVTQGAVVAMKKKMRHAGRGREEKTRPTPKRRFRQGRSQTAHPQSSFRQPIVNVLTRLGGRGRARDVLSGVEREMNLNQADRTKLGSGAVVWKNRVQWARLQLKDEGVLKPDSPHGWWELA